MSRVIVVSNRLPVNITEEAGKLKLNRSIGGLATALGSVMDLYPMLWIGWAGYTKRLSQQQLANLNLPAALIPISISTDLFNSYYYRLANGIIWPMFHGIMPARLDQEADWKAGHKVAGKFAKVIKQNCQEDDLIWIHDYHLLLLPSLLREMGINNRMGFFLHTPFPPPETLTKWRYHQPLLQSLSEVDVLGMQTDRDVKNFKDCLSATGITMRKGAIVKQYPIGIDYKAFHSAWKLKLVAKYIKSLGKLVAGKKVILSVSRLDYTKGIVEQILAIQNILYKNKPGKIIYKLVVAPSRETIKEYIELKEEIDNTVVEVNTRFKEKFGIEPIEYEYRSYGFEELSAWYRIADVLLVAPLKDGMNLIVKEYIAAHEGYGGTVVLSKTVGAARQLRSAILVDPLSIDSITKGLKKAINMPLAEKMQRWKLLKSNVMREDVFWWAKTFLKDLTGQEL